MPFGPFALQWRTPSPNPPSATPLPESITRSSIHTPSGPLELLTALPTAPSSDRPPLFFAHGGFGCAEFWVPYMQYFSARGYPCYAISYRGHGKSWYPSFWRMYFTTRGTMAEDLAAGVRYVEAVEGERREVGGPSRVVLVAHSAGGALAQYALSRGLVQAHGLCLLAAVPGFGSWSCYSFWAPTAPIHAPYRLLHPRYILATIPQVHVAFFTRETPVGLVQRFARLLSPYESMLFPLQALPAFVTGPDVLSSITGWARRSPVGTGLTQRLLVLAAEKDVVCTPKILEDAAQRYEQAFTSMVRKRELEGVGSLDALQGENGVRFRVVKGLAHHLQNHEEWERGADELRDWVEQL